MSAAASERERPRLSRRQALQALSHSLTAQVPPSGGPLGFWLVYGTADARPGEGAGQVAARTTAAYPPVAWNSPGEREQARSDKAQRLATSRVGSLADALGGRLLYRPEQAGRTGDLLTYQFAITVRLHGDQGPLPWLGPVTENETRGPDNGIAPSFGRVLHGDLTVDLNSIPDPVAALTLPRERQLEIYGLEPGMRDRPADTMAAILSESMARGERGVPFPFARCGVLRWGDPAPWLPDSSLNPPSPEADVAGDPEDKALAAQVTEANLRLIQARLASPEAYEKALAASSGQRVREVILLDSVAALISGRLQLAGSPAARNGSRRPRSRGRKDLHALAAQARTFRGSAPPGRTPAALTALRAAAAGATELQEAAGRHLAESCVRHAVGDLSAEVRAELASQDAGTCSYDVQIEVPFENTAGERVTWQRPGSVLPGEPCASVFTVHGLVIDMTALTPEQACAAYPYGYDFFPDWGEYQRLKSALDDMTRPDARSGVVTGVGPLTWSGYKQRTRGSVPRLLRVIAGREQVRQALEEIGAGLPGAAAPAQQRAPASRPRAGLFGQRASTRRSP